MVLSAVAATHGPTPSGSFVVNLIVITPLAFAAGVYVTIEGFAVCAVLLNVPPPGATIDHAAVVAPPPKLAPLNVIAVGVPD